MPYYRGATLHDMVRAGYRAKTAKDLLSIMLPVLEGLSQIHPGYPSCATYWPRSVQSLT